MKNYLLCNHTLMPAYVTVCAWSCHFPLCDEGQLEHPLQHSAQSSCLCSGDQAHALSYQSGHDILGALYDDVVMMRGFWMTTFMSYLHQGWGYKRMNARGRGYQFRDFRCRAYRAELIPCRVLWCVPTSGQPGILYLTTTKMCLVY